MAKKQKVHKPTGYELLCRRIQHAINTPKAQRDGTVVIDREQEETQEDWDRMLEDLETIEEVDLIPQVDGEIRLRWSTAEALA